MSTTLFLVVLADAYRVVLWNDIIEQYKIFVKLSNKTFSKLWYGMYVYYNNPPYILVYTILILQLHIKLTVIVATYKPASTIDCAPL